MATSTYIALANITLSGTDADITFSSIPATYRDLVIVGQWSLTSGAAVLLRFNSDSGNNYNWLWMGGNGSSGFSEAQSNVSGGRLSTTTNADVIFGTQASIMDYSATDKHKTVLCRTGAASLETLAIANRWANTAAITSVSIVTSTSTFKSGSTFALYGIEA